MKVVNLSRRPFINRRPVVRVATCLWVLGALLLLANIWIYTSHFSGSEKGKGRLQSLNRQIQQEEDRLAELWKELKGLNLGNRNQKARYLNSLIHTRTFPWSALFDDLEKVLPIDVYLASVQPSLRLAKQPAASASATPTRALTAREARARARGESTTESSDAEDEALEEQEEESYFSGDRVTLTLRGYARNDEALFEFVDLLYQSPSFLDPTLSRESKDKTGKLSFNIKTVYLTPKKNAPPPEEGDPGAELALASEGSSNRSEAGNRPEMVSVIEEPVPGVEAQPSTLRPTGSSSGTDSQTRASRTQTERGSRDVRRAGPQVNTGFPPEEGESEVEQARRRRNSRTGGSRSVTRAPSTVSVAPGATSSIEDARAREEAEKEARARARAQQRRQQQQNAIPGLPRTTPSPTRPGTRPSTSRSGATTPSPTLPAASSSPRLQGSLFDRWIPDFLLWTPDFSEPTYSEPRRSKPSYAEGIPFAQQPFGAVDLLTEALPMTSSTDSSELGHVEADSSQIGSGSFFGTRALVERSRLEFASVHVRASSAWHHWALATPGPDRIDRLLPPLDPKIQEFGVVRDEALKPGVTS